LAVTTNAELGEVTLVTVIPFLVMVGFEGVVVCLVGVALSFKKA
jgi:hypothetical protein